MDICKANHANVCIKCTPGPCDSRKTLDVPATHVKPQKKSAGSVTVDVGINGMDETIKQLQALKRLYCDIDTLQQRIIKGAEKVKQVSGIYAQEQEIDWDNVSPRRKRKTEIECGLERGSLD